MRENAWSGHDVLDHAPVASHQTDVGTSPGFGDRMSTNQIGAPVRGRHVTANPFDLIRMYSTTVEASKYSVSCIRTLPLAAKREANNESIQLF